MTRTETSTWIDAGHCICRRIESCLLCTFQGQLLRRLCCGVQLGWLGFISSLVDCHPPADTSNALQFYNPNLFHHDSTTCVCHWLSASIFLWHFLCRDWWRVDHIMKWTRRNQLKSKLCFGFLVEQLNRESFSKDKKENGECLLHILCHPLRQ